VKVVYLTVEDKPDGAVLIAHRLRRGIAQVDDRKPSMAQSDISGVERPRRVPMTYPVEIHTASIRSPVNEELRHGHYCFNTVLIASGHEPAYSTHTDSPPDAREKSLLLLPFDSCTEKLKSQKMNSLRDKSPAREKD